MLEKVTKLRKMLLFFAVLLLVLALGRSAWIEPLSHKISASEIPVDSIRWEDCTQVGENSWDYTATLPESFASEQVISVMACWVSTEVYVNDRCVFTYADPNRDKGTARLWIPLPQWAAGQTIHVIYTGAQSQAELSASEDTYMGSASMVFLAFVMDKAYALVFSASVLLMVLFIGYFYLLLRKHIDIGSRRALIDLILFMLTTGVWIVGDSKLLLIISRNVAANTIITYNALILFPIFLVMFVSEMVEHRLPFLDVLPALFLLDDLVMMLGYLTHSFSPYQCLDSVHILMGISMLLGVGGSVWDVKKNKNAEMIKLLAGFTCFGLFGVLSIVQYRVSRVSNYPMYCCIGLLIFMLFIIWAASGKLYRIMDQNASAQAYQKLAYLDVMTGMGNRAAFVKAQSELSAEISVGLAIMDINNLKYTNDHYGHQAGDEMICSAAACIDRAFGANGRVYRIGGDEFAVIVKNATEELMENMLGALEQALLETQQAQDRPWKLQIAYGYALHVGGAAQDNFETLFKQADDRMYERKRRMKAADKI